MNSIKFCDEINRPIGLQKEIEVNKWTSVDYRAVLEKTCSPVGRATSSRRSTTAAQDRFTVYLLVGNLKLQHRYNFTKSGQCN